MANHDQIVNCRMFPWQIYRINAQNHQTPRRPGDASIAAPFTTKAWMGCYGQDLRTSGCMVPADRTRKRTFQDHSSLNTKKDKKGVLFPKIDDVTATPSLKPLVVVAASVLRYHKITLCLSPGHFSTVSTGTFCEELRGLDSTRSMHALVGAPLSAGHWTDSDGF